MRRQIFRYKQWIDRQDLEAIIFFAHLFPNRLLIVNLLKFVAVPKQWHCTQNLICSDFEISASDGWKFARFVYAWRMNENRSSSLIILYRETPKLVGQFVIKSSLIKSFLYPNRQFVVLFFRLSARRASARISSIIRRRCGRANKPSTAVSGSRLGSRFLS